MAQGGESLDVTQDHESFDVAQDHEPVEWPVEPRLEFIPELIRDWNDGMVGGRKCEGLSALSFQHSSFTI